MLKPETNPYTKDEELEMGRQVQEGIKATKRIESEPLNKEELSDLLGIAKKGKEAQTKLFNAEVGLANKQAIRLYKRAGIRYSLDDIAQDAYLALTEATNSYDPDKGCRLSTYAYYRISKLISVRLNKMRSIRLPENKMGQQLAITRAEKKYLAQCGEFPNPIDMEKFVLKETGLDKNVYLIIKQSLQPVTSTSAPISENGQFEDLLEDKTAKSKLNIENQVLMDLIMNLSDDEQQAISVAYNLGGAGTTYTNYIKSHDLTPEDMERKVKKIVRKLRKSVKNNKSF